MKRVVIVDDSEEQARALAALVDAATGEGFAPATVVSPADPGLAGLVAQADILIMDINLDGDGTTGVDVVRAMAPADAQVIYTSGYLEYVPQIYRTRHVGFLAKPVDPIMLAEALERAGRALEDGRSRPLVVKSGDHLLKLNPRRILYVESARRRLLIHEQSRVVETYARIGDIERRLPACFVRCHKSFLVNLAQVAELAPHEARLVGGARVPVSQRLAACVRERFQDYVARSL